MSQGNPGLPRATYGSIKPEEMREYIRAEARKFGSYVVRERAREGEDWVVEDNALGFRESAKIIICDWEALPTKDAPPSARTITSGTKVMIVLYDAGLDEISLSTQLWGGKILEERDSIIGDEAHRTERKPLGAVLAEANVRPGTWIAIQDYYASVPDGKIRFRWISMAAYKHGSYMLSSRLWLDDIRFWLDDIR